MIDWREYLTSDPKVCQGQLCAKGTRVLVANILDSLAEGATREEILRSYPTLRPEHIGCGSRLCGRTRPRRSHSAAALRVKIKLDENLPAELVADFRAAGIDNGDGRRRGSDRVGG